MQQCYVYMLPKPFAEQLPKRLQASQRCCRRRANFADVTNLGNLLSGSHHPERWCRQWLDFAPNNNCLSVDAKAGDLLSTTLWGCPM